MNVKRDCTAESLQPSRYCMQRIKEGVLQSLPAADHILAVIVLYGVGDDKGAVLEDVPSQLQPCTHCSCICVKYSA